MFDNVKMSLNQSLLTEAGKRLMNMCRLFCIIFVVLFFFNEWNNYYMTFCLYKNKIASEFFVLLVNELLNCCLNINRDLFTFFEIH